MSEDSKLIGRPEPGRRTLHLLYHELRREPSDYTYAIEAAKFEQHLRLFTEVERDPSALTPNITFDDGHISNLELALPALRAHRLTARFFITAGWTGQKRNYMNWSELRTLHQAGQQIGAHGWTHKLLTHCSTAELDQGSSESPRLRLEEGIGAPVTTMSLPGGRSNRRVLEACQAAGYEHIYTSVPMAEPASPGLTIGRFNIRGQIDAAWLRQLLDPATGTLSKLQRQHKVKQFARQVAGDRLYAKLWSVLNRGDGEAEEASV